MAKKTKKIETPIDQRETFVSIQKSFADSDLPVAEKLKTLYALQQADTEIDKILQLRGELPMEVEALEAELAELKAKSERISELIEGYTRSISDNKLNIAECDAQIEKYKAQLENVANSREYDSLNKEIENQELLRQIAEKNINETKERIFEKKNELEIVKEKAAVRAEDLKAKNEELATIVDATAKEEEELRAVLASDKKKFISVGRFSKEKGHARLIRAFETVHKENPDTLLIILGGYGVLFNETKRLAEESSCPGAIFIIRYM